MIKWSNRYQDVQIKFIPHKPAILTISVDGEETEKVDLEVFKTRLELHNLFVEKGFLRKNEDEIRAMKNSYAEEKKTLRVRAMKNSYAEEKKKKALLRHALPNKKVPVLATNNKDVKGAMPSSGNNVVGKSAVLGSNKIVEDAMIMGISEVNTLASLSSSYLFQFFGMLVIGFIAYRQRAKIASLCNKRQDRTE
uniref:Uncharacterized protein n=1 Tax=Proboscia inermis TaxID=420281 RepID=A0A7S0G989_9STRA|mmetsp:Transcript_10422/g.10498  ORF Transcript_10422/g.10498 Transcript_10422/m.10498 type:complete len:194 (+) Transcript_10422:420-1001(+)